MASQEPQKKSAEESTISMSPDEERRYLENTEQQTEPADEGVGAVTDNEDRDPATEN